jgi:hypothetical protein
MNGYTNVYYNTGTSWALMGDSIVGPAPGSSNGYAVSLSGDGHRLLVTAYTLNSDTGDVRVYSYNGTPESGSWSMIGSPIPGDFAGEYFGTSCSMSEDGDTIAVGGTGWATQTGRVKAFRYDGTSYASLGAPINGLNTGDNFGWGVSLSSDGNRLVSSSPDWNSTRGQTVAFDYSGGSWTQIGQSINGLVAGDNNGWAVSLSRDSTTVATSSAYYNGTNGRTRILRFNSSDTSGSSTGTWEQVGNMITGDGGEYSGFDVSLSADGGVVAIGDVGWSDFAGKTNIYSYASATDTWDAKGSPIQGAAGSEAGFSVALSNDGDVVGIGAIIANNGTGEASVYFYNGE